MIVIVATDSNSAPNSLPLTKKLEQSINHDATIHVTTTLSFRN
jgi:hypothetical protein